MKPLTLQQQAALIRLRFPKAQLRLPIVRGEPILVCRVVLQPAPTSLAYTVDLLYDLGCRPLVVVVDPKPVTEIDGRPTPHLNYDGTLCLYDPAIGEWTPSMAIAHTTLPWATRWLFHYEHWQLFAEWRGDGPQLSPCEPIER